MKKYLILSLIATVAMANTSTDKSDLIAEYKNMFEKIGEKRIGVDEHKIDALHAPFIVTQKKVAGKKTDTVAKDKSVNHGYVLQAILNKSAKISGKWYKLHGNVHGMKVISIRENYVWLKNDQFRKKLILGSKNEKISIK